MARIRSVRRLFISDVEEIYQQLLADGADKDHALKYCEYLERKRKQKFRGRTTNARKDSFKTKTYKAEWAFENVYKKFGKWRTFKDGAEAQKYADKVVNSSVWKQIKSELCFADAGVAVKAQKMNGRTAGMAWMDRIVLCSRTGLNEYTLLHELAHVAGYMHHDLSFRQALIALVKRFMGREAAKHLKAAFKAQGLQMQQKSTEMTFEQYVARVQRLEAARAKKA